MCTCACVCEYLCMHNVCVGVCVGVFKYVCMLVRLSTCFFVSQAHRQGSGQGGLLTRGGTTDRQVPKGEIRFIAPCHLSQPPPGIR